MDKKETAKSFKLTKDTIKKINELAELMGITEKAVISVAVHKFYSEIVK